MTNTPAASGALWARFRFGVVGALLSAPPPRGALKAAIHALAAKTWTHPLSGQPVQFAAVTIERWYYRALNAKDDPVGVLRRAVRKDCGKVSLPAAVAECLRRQYHEHPHWSYQLHYDNLAARLQAEPALGALRSYATVRRYVQTHGLPRQPKPRPRGAAGEARAAERRQTREVRSFEVEHVGSLWHLDFHHGSLKVLTHRGQWQRPLALAILDDHSRLCCHAQWYLSETAADLVHGLAQAIQKRGLPRALMTDNGAAGLLAYFRSLQRQLDLSLVLVHHTRKNAAGVAAGQGLRGSGDIHAFGDSNLYLRRSRDHLVLSSEHRAAPAAPPVALQLVATDAATTHLEVIAALDDQPRRCLQDQVLDLLAPGAVLTRVKLRDALGVKNERLGEALASLEQSGRLCRTAAGWRRPD